LTDRFDPLIDDVARAMTSAPSDERLAERVAARIADARAPRRWVWIMVPIAAAAVVLIALAIVRLKPDTTHDATTNATIRGADIAIASEPTPVVQGVRALIVPIAQAPSPALAPIEIDSITVQPLVETNAIQITPIAIDRIEIAAMP
jgi:hypothetical protein